MCNKTDISSSPLILINKYMFKDSVVLIGAVDKWRNEMEGEILP
jgi:hypothetical protein